MFTEQTEKYFDRIRLEKYFDQLYPICRSITGLGFRQSIEILSEMIPLEYEYFNTGDDVLDWTIPDEWNISDAYIITPDGNKIADFKKHNLHIMNYSEPFEGEISLAELKEHLYTLPDRPDTIPYICSYYKKRWGFCITQRLYENLREGTYKVVIKSTLAPGQLMYGQAILPGETDEEILLTTYLCHPQMANHELSGPLTLSTLYQMLAAKQDRKYTYRFLVCPENIGSAAFLSVYGQHLKNKLKAGFIINCVGYGEHFTYKKSRQGDSLADKAAINVLEHINKPLKMVDFFPDGSDERQFCSPGFNLPVGLIMRIMYNTFPEYHTSDDNKDLISFDTIKLSIDAYYRVCESLEINFIPYGKVQYGTPQLSKSPIPLYRDIMNFRQVDKSERIRVTLEILNQADGKKDLLQIALEKNFCLFDFKDLVSDLCSAGYIKEYVQ